MKMVVMEVRGGTAVALREDGAFVRISGRGRQVGQTIRLSPVSGAVLRFPRAAAACLAAVILLGGGALALRAPYSYVTMDVNPSVKYTLNVFDRVLDVAAVNEDASAVVGELEKENLSYRPLDDVIEMTIDRCREDGYLYEDGKDYVVLSVSSVSGGRTERLSEELKSASFGGGLISAEVVPTTVGRMKEAAQRRTTPGKLELIGRMQEKTGDTAPAESWVNASVRDIILAAGAPGNGQASGKEKTAASEPSAGPELQTDGQAAGQADERSGSGRNSTGSARDTRGGGRSDIPAVRPSQPVTGGTGNAQAAQNQPGTPRAGTASDSAASSENGKEKTKSSASPRFGENGGTGTENGGTGTKDDATGDGPPYSPGLQPSDGTGEPQPPPSSDGTGEKQETGKAGESAGGEKTAE